MFRLGPKGACVFWMGLVDDKGQPLTSRHISDAYVFPSGECALHVAHTHDALRDSEVWKVVPR